MKRALIAAVFLTFPVLAWAADEEYHFNVYVFDTEEMYKSVGEGTGNPGVCKHLFAPPMQYDGRAIPIPTNATVFGVIAVTDGKTTKVIPLFKWPTDAGRPGYGCNGPTPWFARWERTQDDLIKRMVEAIEAK